MKSKFDLCNTELLQVIVNYGMGAKVTKFAKKFDIIGSSLTYARGTVNNKIMEYLGISDTLKEIIYLVVPSNKAKEIMIELSRKFKFDKPNCGIVFSTKITHISCKIDGERNVEREEDEHMYDLITTVVDRGNGEDVISAAKKGGSNGGTIMNARGSGIGVTSKVFSVEIEPEREIVIILSKSDKTDSIVSSINKLLEDESECNGIVYVQEVSKAYGMYEK
ncbi:P-II family nitrogen regulator [Peptostreptococcus faecalis]|uniref:P-II family nitrogen regulator n=1 Tax=Peptostreptococcus faecalis TaxID=2045015 RepID=UPI001FA8DC4F|nr:P-II family nitrogen regulator [Peptostreptococcus faecalis]